MIVALALWAAFAPPADAWRDLDVDGDVSVVIQFGASPTRSAEGKVDVKVDGGTMRVRAAQAGDSGTVRVVVNRLEKIKATGTARIEIVGFEGKALHVVASDAAVVVVAGKADKLSVMAKGTSRVDADALTVAGADVTLKDAARARVRATRTLSCDLERASKLVVRGNPSDVKKKLTGVARLEMK